MCESDAAAIASEAKKNHVGVRPIRPHAELSGALLEILSKRLVHGFRIGERFGNVRIQKDDISTFPVIIVILASRTGAEVFTTVFISYFVFLSHLRKCAFHGGLFSGSILYAMRHLFQYEIRRGFD